MRNPGAGRPAAVPAVFAVIMCASALLLGACGGGGGSSASTTAGGGSGGSGGSSGGYGGSSGGSGSSGASGSGANDVYSMSKLVSDGSVAAPTTDHDLVNPWGIAFAASAPVWVANNGSQTATVYDGTGIKLSTSVAFPAGQNGPANPTGVVAYGGTAFVISKGSASGPARYIFDGLDGTLLGWSSAVDAANAIIAYDDGNGGAVYTGLAMATNAGGATQLYAADFHNNKIDVFDDTFAKQPAGGFTDSTLPAGYAPFGIQALTVQSQTLLYVTYAMQQAPTDHEAMTGAGLGLVDVYDTQGNLKNHLIATGGKLNAPWGLALAPTGFGGLANALLVGNFGDGWINGFDPSTGAFIGTVNDASGQAIATPGLWGIAFGNGSSNQKTGTLYFAAGISSQAGGLYGRIDPGATPPDVVAPTVSLTAPAAGATVSGTVTVTASATDDVGVTAVTFFAGSTQIGMASAAPYSASWDTTKAANGTVSLTAQATDAAGNVGTSAAVSVTVDNTATPPPPAVSFAQLQSQIFTPICSGCHTGGGTSLPASMNLTAGNAYASLVNVASVEQPSLKRVDPGNPNSSYLVLKLEGAAGISGQRMPLGGPYLDQATINQVISWISAGAPNN